MDKTKCTKCGSQWGRIEALQSKLDENGKSTHLEYVCFKCGYILVEKQGKSSYRDTKTDN